MTELVVGGLAPAVQYVRMSTEHQRYSLDNQKAAIAAYAAHYGFQVIASYEDAGRSGLTLKEREGLNRLLHDVTSPDRRFSTILVLDISRWGRFQDPDQHGAYEFLCREMGVNIEYVAEGFENDSSPGSTLMKNLKRVMAGEYSRELSAKISFAQQETARRGFKLGGPTLYGFRRLAVDSEGNPQRVLDVGEHKYLRSDRIVLVHGPDNELHVIQRIFSLFIDKRISLNRIADILNGEGVPAQGGRWSRPRVHSILTSELILGTYVYGKSRIRLKTPRVANPEAVWIRTSMLPPIISAARFRQAAALLKSPSYPFCKSKMIRELKKLLKEKGELSVLLIDGCPDLPNYRTIARHLGPISAVYKLLGYDPTERRQMPRKTPRLFTKEEGLQALRDIHAQYGFLNQVLLHSTYDAPSAQWYRRQFGSLTNAYQAAGFNFTATQLRVEGLRRLRARYVNGPPGLCPPDTPWVESVSDEEMLAGIRRLFEENGFISMRLIQADPRLPPARFLYRRFASVLHAYQMAGLNFTRSDLTRMAIRAGRSETERAISPVQAPFDLSARLLEGVGRLQKGRRKGKQHIETALDPSSS